MIGFDSVYRFGDFEVDANRFELRERGSPIPIERRPLELILYLIEHRDRLVTKEELARNLWKCHVVSDASLRQAVATARRALRDRDHDQRSILTVRGKGFRFLGAVPAVSDATACLLEVSSWFESHSQPGVLHDRAMADLQPLSAIG